MWQRFTESARHTILVAQKEATGTPYVTVEPEHLLLGLLASEGTLAAEILDEAGINRTAVQATLNLPPEPLQLAPPEVDDLVVRFQVAPELVRQIEEGVLRKLRAQQGKPDLKLSSHSKMALELAADEARRLKRTVQHSGDIDTQHLLLGLLRQDDTPAGELLREAGLTLEGVRDLIIERTKARHDEAA